MQTKTKNLTIESIRGFAILLIVLGHVIGNVPSKGLMVANDSLYRYVYYLIDFFQVAMFAFVSGYVYAFKPVVKENAFNFVKNKFFRIYVPMVVVSIIQYLVRVIVPGTNMDANIVDIWKVLFFSFDQFWFLQSLLVIFLIVGVIDYFKLVEKYSYWLYGLVMMIFLAVAKLSVPYFSVTQSFYLLPLFFLGLGYFRFKDLLCTKRSKYVSYVMLVLMLFVGNYFWFKGVWQIYGRDSLIGIAIGYTGSVAFLLSGFQHKVLNYLGKYSYSIFLYHIFGLAGARILLRTIGVNNVEIVFIASIICGIVFPLIADYVLSKNKFTSKLMLGRGIGN